MTFDEASPIMEAWSRRLHKIHHDLEPDEFLSMLWLKIDLSKVKNKAWLNRLCWLRGWDIIRETTHAKSKGKYYKKEITLEHFETLCVDGEPEPWEMADLMDKLDRCDKGVLKLALENYQKDAGKEMGISQPAFSRKLKKEVEKLKDV